MKLSIITVVLNDKRHIRSTINSVLSQTLTDKEYIIIDGGSTDGTQEIIQRYTDKVKWLSEPDNGIYDAMMKGVRMAKGEWILFLNSGDYLENDTVLNSIFDRYTDNGESFLIANALFFKQWGVITVKPHILNHNWYDAMPMIHPSTLIRRSEQLRYPFHLEYKFSADYMFFVESLVNGGKYQYFDTTISCVNLQEGATATHWDKSLKDNLSILKKMGAPDSAIKKVMSFYHRALLEKIILRIYPKYQQRINQKSIQCGGWQPTTEPYESRFLIDTDVQ